MERAMRLRAVQCHASPLRLYLHKVVPAVKLILDRDETM